MSPQPEPVGKSLGQSVLEVKVAPASQKVASDLVVKEAGDIDFDYDCAVCYLPLCEPVRAGCQKHIFCRNCLLKSQRLHDPPKCPVCRAECLQDAVGLPEVTELAVALRSMDPDYEERRAQAKREREEYKSRLVRVSLVDGRGGRFEVCGAGSDEINGIYEAGVLPTYLGPTVYRKPNSQLFIFRWHQVHWVIAELHGPYSMGNEREWLYRAPTQHPPQIPPAQGWEVPPRGRGDEPSPEVRLVERGSRWEDGNLWDPPAPLAEAVRVQNGPRTARRNNSCRCTPQCSVM